jgi:hypothetical protein
MTQTEALRLALEALESAIPKYTSQRKDQKTLGGSLDYWKLSQHQRMKAITAIKAALLSRSDGEAQTRSVDKDEPWTLDDTAYRPNGLPQEFIKHEVESPDDWSEWVCPNPDEYFMKCCDCGLVHEVQYRVARYGEGDYCELVEDKDVQAQFRMRRRTPPNPEVKNEKPWVCECGADSYNACKCVFKAALEAKDEPVDFEAIIDDIEAIDCRYRGDPSYDRDAYWMRDEVVATVKRHASFYTTPPPVAEPHKRKPLTDEEIDALYEKHIADCWDSIEDQMGDPVRIMSRAIEAAHGIKGEA